MRFYLLIGCIIAACGCSSLKKDNEAKDPPSLSEDVAAQRAVYVPLVAADLDSYGLAVMGGSIGDSALFSCLARVGGAATFDPMILFVGGKPRRHPDIAPSAPNAEGKRGTPISKDMMNGILWCAYDVGLKGDKEKAHQITSALIAFGLGHQDKVAGWFMCDEQDRTDYNIHSDDWIGKCLMPPAVVKDIYRVHKWAGGDCDDDCRYWSDIGVNIPGGRTGFERHLDTLTTMRNGLVEGAINDNSLKALQESADSQPRNALYQAVFHLFGSGNQEAAFAALMDESLFPHAALPTAANYCTEYLFQRDEDQKDWVPCDDAPAGARGRGIEWIFAATIALGDAR